MKYYLTRLNNSTQAASVCPHCGKEFKNLSEHIKVHHLGLKRRQPAQCDICKKVFTQKAHLKEHIRSVHEQVKEYKCKFCLREFYRKPNFKRHMQSMHMNVAAGEEVGCEECGRMFKTKNSLYKHRRTVHEGHVVAKPMFCEDCGQSFTQSGSLYAHMRKVHGREPEIANNRRNNLVEKMYVDTSLILELHPELGSHL